MKRRLLRASALPSPLILFLLVTLILLVSLALLAPVLFPVNLADTHLELRLLSPMWMDNSSPHLFGTDSLGRDVAVRLLYAVRTSLAISFVGMLLASALGLLIGVLSGMNRGKTDHVLMFMTDAQLSIPTTLIGIICATVLGSNWTTTVLIIGLTGWPGFARLVRGQVLQLREANFIECSHAIGASKLAIFWEHILPNIASPLIVQATMSLSAFILLESTLSYIGLGIQPPETSLGVMISEGRDYMLQNWWLTIVPSLVMVLLIMQIALLGDWLRDRLDPKLNHGK